MNPIQLLGSGGGVDKLGIFTGKAVWHVSTEEEAIAFLASRQPHGGIPFSAGTYEQDDAAEYIVTVQYEGTPPGGGGGGGSEELTEFSFDGTMGVEKIQSHPKFEDLKKKFEWDDQEKIFTGVTATTPSEDGLPGMSTPADLAAANQIQGTDSWLVVGGEYTISYTRPSIPAGLFLGIGTKVAKPRGFADFNLSLGNRSFLKLCPRVKKRGNVVEIQERYQLSGPKGISEDVYGAGQLDPESDPESDSGAA